MSSSQDCGFLENHRVFAGNAARTPSLGDWSYDKNENCKIMDKLRYIEEKAVGGHCYLRLITMLPIFDRIKLDLFKDVVNNFAEETGHFPVAKDMIVRLAALNSLVKSGGALGGNAADPEFDPEIFNQMMMNRHRFEMTVEREIIHVSSVWYTFDDPSDRNKENPGIDTDLCVNYSSKYIIVMLGASNRCVGGSVIDLDKLFDESCESEVTYTPEQLSRYRATDSVVQQVTEYMEKNSHLAESESESAPDSEGKTTEDTESSVSSLANTILDQHEMIFNLKKQLELNNENHRKTKETLKQFIKKNPNQSTENPKSETTEKTIRATKDRWSDSESLALGDSVSTYNPRMRTVNPKTIIIAQHNDRHKIDTIVEVDDLSFNRQVVVGYQKTTEMQKTERKLNDKVLPINGLANPFRNNRLNLLMHFHTAVETNLPIDNPQGYFHSLKRIIRYKSKSPSEELSKQIITLTFDFDDYVVVANPYRLPFIEVGMIISDNCLVSCFTLLKSEFEALWFQEMKSLYVPTFHKRFRHHSETTVDRKMSGKNTGSRSGGSSSIEGSTTSSRPVKTGARSLFSIH